MIRCKKGDFMGMRGSNQWKDRFQEVIRVCQTELKKTTNIGKKMLSASKTNSSLHEAYLELGQLAFKEVENQNLKWDDHRVSELIALIKTCEEDLKNIEEDVQEIKKTRLDNDD